MSKSLCGRRLSSLSGKYRGVTIAGPYGKCVCNLLRNSRTVTKWPHLFTLQPPMHEGSGFSLSSLPPVVDCPFQLLSLGRVFSSHPAAQTRGLRLRDGRRSAQTAGEGAAEQDGSPRVQVGPREHRGGKAGRKKCCRSWEPWA